MSRDPEYRGQYRLYSVLFLLVAALMPLVLLKTPSGLIPDLLFASPYVLLFGLWISFRGVNKRSRIFESRLDDETRVAFRSVRDFVDMQVIFGLSGIAVALAMGWNLGHLAAQSTHPVVARSAVVYRPPLPAFH